MNFSPLQKDKNITYNHLIKNVEILSRTMSMDTIMSNEKQISRKSIKSRKGRDALSSSERGKRFRSEQKIKLSKLITDIGRLMGTMESLSTYRNALQQRALQLQSSSEGSCIKKVYLYMDKFKLGGSERTPVQLQRLQEQQQVLNCIMDPYVQLLGPQHPNGAYGIDNFYNRWKHICSNNTSIELTSGLIEVVTTSPTIRIKAEGKVTSRFSIDTIKAFYPHILADPTFVQEVIGLKVTIGVTRWFDFDNSGKIIAVTSQVEFLPGFVEALGNIEDAMMLLDKSRFSMKLVSPPIKNTVDDINTNDIVMDNTNEVSQT